MGDQLPLPSRELRARLDRVMREHAWVATEVARMSLRPPSDPREVVDFMTGLERHLLELRDACSEALRAVGTLADLAGEDWERAREAERKRFEEGGS